ncbi:MAG: hypothetical protein RBS05_12450 [Zoogloea oleivorans]|jgi:hypothetical protein|uniref:hypothetical protein n=1 Tax=Zoogloea oleivorans TaxID=1552750 RepID=UPI002A35C64D|nr:hypothetical protein [Zoogloea oleivorans]MDY0036711.1 hypothetical protein [Zoogloea oleivorans]
MNAITRTAFGEIAAPTNPALAALIKGALEMAAQAAAKGKIPAAHDAMSWQRINSRIGSKRIGEAIHHEVYDLTPDGRKALVCIRAVEGTKYGIKTTGKEYFILARHGKGVRATPANKAVAAKAAKAAGELGQALDVVEGRVKLVTATAKPRTGFKLVRRDEAGELVSAWDGSPWTLGVTRTEAATDDHSGGFYYYRTAEAALSAADRGEVFGQARAHDALVLIEVEVSGREYEHPQGKICATRITPVRIVSENV